MRTFDIKAFNWNSKLKSFMALEWELLPDFNDLENPEQRIGDSFKIKNYETGQEREFVYESMVPFDEDTVAPHTVSVYRCEDMLCEIISC